MAADTKSKTPAPPEKSSSRPTNVELPLAPVFTLVLWLTCLTVGAVGFVLPYARPMVICFCEEPVEAQKLEVELQAEEVRPAELPAPDPSLPPPPPEAMTPPPLPQAAAPVVAAAVPSPAIAFAVPVLNPTRIAPTAQSASHIIPATAPRPVAPPGPPAPTAITFGRGEGKQPAPKYPRQAVREGQEGTVGVRFSVGQDGRVVVADLSAPSPWNLLNREALRVIREEWRFSPGPARLHEISIVFQLTR